MRKIKNNVLSVNGSCGVMTDATISTDGEYLKCACPECSVKHYCVAMLTEERGVYISFKGGEDSEGNFIVDTKRKMLYLDDVNVAINLVASKLKYDKNHEVLTPDAAFSLLRQLLGLEK